MTQSLILPGTESLNWHNFNLKIMNYHQEADVSKYKSTKKINYGLRWNHALIDYSSRKLTDTKMNEDWRP